MKRFAVVLLVLVTLLVTPATAITFDNDGGGTWAEYYSFPITTAVSEYAQYKIVINGSTWELHNVTGNLETSGTNSNFWSLVNSTGVDIRVFNDSKQMYFWIEYFNATEQKAIIWVNLTAGSSELNVAYGNPSASKSDYENPEQVFEFFDDFTGTSLNTAKWSVHGNSTKITVSDELILEKIADDAVAVSGNIGTMTDVVFEFKYHQEDNGYASSVSIGSGTVTQSGDNNQTGNNGWFVDNGYYVGLWDYDYGSVYKWVIGKASGGTLTELASTTHENGADLTYHAFRLTICNGQINLYRDGELILSATDSSFSSFTTIVLSNAGGNLRQSRAHFDDVKVLKLTDPADFGTPIVKSFQKRFGTKTVYVNVTYLDTATTNRYNPTAYYKLEDKPQINVTSTLSVTGVNTTYGANISIELINFVTLDKVVYNGTDITGSLIYQGTITNSTTGYTYNVYNFTTYENGTLEIYGHVGNKAYEATFKLDGETVDVFNVTAVVGEALEITLPHRGNVTLASIEHTNVTSIIINTKDVGVGAKTLTITIEDPENFTVGYRNRTVNIDWGKILFNVTDLQNKTLARTTYGFFNKNFSIVSTDPTKLYAGDIEIDVYFHDVKLKSLEIHLHLNHSNNGLTLNVSVNATQFKDYRNVTRIIASPNYFEVVNLSTKYPFSVMELVNVSGTIVIDFVSNAPTSVKVEGATSYTYEKPVLKITASGNITITDLYKLSTPLKDRLGNPVNFYVLINGSRVDASKGVASKLLKPSWYEVEVPVSVSGFELWKFNDSSNIVLVEINTSDETLPTAEYRVPSKIETKEVRIQKTKFPWLPFPFPFLSESKPAQEETPIVRLEGTLRDFYNAPVANRTIKIEVASPNFTRIYNVTTDESGNFKIEVDMARGVEYKVTYKFAGDDVYVATSTTKTFTIEQLLPAPPEEMTIEEILIFVGIAVGLVAVVAGAIYLAKRTKAKTLARMESEFKFFRRLK